MGYKNSDKIERILALNQSALWFIKDCRLLQCCYLADGYLNH